MYRLLCCRTRNPNRVEVEQFTDSLETCLTVDRGVREFTSFLRRNNFNEESTTLAFALRCQTILADISRLSPITRETRLPARINNDIEITYDMANTINFDLDQMNALQNLRSTDIEQKMHTLQLARGWAINLLQDIYSVFRKEVLRGV